MFGNMVGIMFRHAVCNIEYSMWYVACGSLKLCIVICINTLDEDITIDDTAAPFLLLRLTGIAELATVFC